MFDTYYQQELHNLKELAREYSAAHPSVAPLLSGPSADPDVERVLEGVAFLTGLLNRKLDEDQPELIHSLMDVIFPHYLRPVPALSIVTFTPRPGLQQTTIVPAGISLAAVPVDGTRCIFRTCYATEVHPLRLTSAEIIEKPRSATSIRLSFELTKFGLSHWNPTRLCLYLGGDFSHAANLFSLLNRYLQRIILAPSDARNSTNCELTPDCLVPVGFDSEHQLLPYPARSFSGYRVIQEYFTLPQKFLFLELRGWEKWVDRGDGKQFTVTFDLAPSPLQRPSLTVDSFILSATPVINLFQDKTDQVVNDFRAENIRIRPSSRQKEHYQVYSIDKVIGYRQGITTPREYLPLELFSGHRSDGYTYQVTRKRSVIDDSVEAYLSFAYPSDKPPTEPETLSLLLTLTNGNLPERLHIGDICEQAADSPGLLEFKNIVAPSSPINPPRGKNTLWKLLSHLSMNFLRFADVNALKSILSLYVFPEGTDKTRINANVKRIEGVLDMTVEPSTRMVDGIIMRGQRVILNMRHDAFASIGDMCLFTIVLDTFLGMYSTLNTFVQLELHDQISGETFSWPTRIGTRPLL